MGREFPKQQRAKEIKETFSTVAILISDYPYRTYFFSFATQVGLSHKIN